MDQISSTDSYLNTKQLPERLQNINNSENACNIHPEVALQPSYQSNSSSATPLKVAATAVPNNVHDGSVSNVAGPIIGRMPLPLPSQVHNPSNNNIAPNNHAKESIKDFNNASTTKDTDAITSNVGRRTSIAEAVLAGAATAAHTAATAASSVVEAARKLVIRDGDEESLSSSKGISATDHHGLEFSHRKMSLPLTGPNKEKVQSEHLPATVSTTSVGTTKPYNEDFSGAIRPSNSQEDSKHSDEPLSGINDLNSHEKTRVNTASTSTPPNSTNVIINEDKQRPPAENGPLQGPTTTNMEPRNTTLRTLYVTGHGPESARHHAMHVDKPAISHIENPETNYSALGVDIPRIVGHSEHPINYRRGSLHVDGKDDLIRDPHHPDYHGHSIHVPHYNHDSLTQGTKLGAPIQTSRDNSKVIHGNVHHRTQNTLPEAVAAIRKNPFEAHMSHRRASYSSGLNVDYPAIPTANLAGSGSTDNTNHDRPEGVRNSAINVDRAGSLDRKHCGMGVDAPALASHEIASSVCFGSKNTHAGETKNMARDSTSVASSERHYLDGDHESIFDKVKGVFHRRSSVKSSDIPATQSSISAGKGKGRAPDIVNSTALPSELSTDVPAGYEGPIPQAGPGEQVVWVKKTTQTEIYDEPEDTAVPSETQDHTSRRHSSSSSKSFFNRLRSRHSTSSSDKGKNPAR